VGGVQTDRQAHGVVHGDLREMGEEKTMSKSIIEQADLAHFEELAGDEKVSSALWNVVSMANKRIKDYPKESEIFGQYFSRNPIPPHHLYYYAVIVDWIMTGKLTVFGICLGEEPSADAEVDENNKKLSKLQEVLSAEFFGGKGDCDGIVTWNKPMEMNMCVDGKEIARIIKPAGNAPLEVGYTSFVRTHDHLLVEGVLARWPYGHKHIYVMSLNGDS
jgi:hypothetical protein